MYTLKPAWGIRYLPYFKPKGGGGGLPHFFIMVLVIIPMCVLLLKPLCMFPKVQHVIKKPTSLHFVSDPLNSKHLANRKLSKC